MSDQEQQRITRYVGTKIAKILKSLGENVEHIYGDVWIYTP